LNEVSERIAGEIRGRGAITFAHFMELALYCPICGYYEKEEDIIGRRGDFYTNVSVGKLFGELLAFQFAEWLEPSARPAGGSPGPGLEVKGGTASAAMRIAEAGAHDGALAGDILGWMREHRPRLFQHLEYWIIEPSDRRRDWQRRKLGEFGNQVRWVGELAELMGKSGVGGDAPRPPGVRDILFCNELLDAMPVHRLGWDAPARAWFEWGVALEEGHFVWTRMADEQLRDRSSRAKIPFPHSDFPIAEELLGVLPDGFTTEACPAAERWWRMAAGALKCGKLLAIDYGLSAEEFFSPERKAGTLRGYQQHRSSSDVLTNPGGQDITAHVNFTAIRAAGESAGLSTETFLTQAQFLTGIAGRAWQEPGAFGEWTPERTRQFHTLTHPEHLGRSFRVLVQERPAPLTPRH